MTENSQNWQPHLYVLVGGMLYYAVMLLFGLAHFESKFIMDGFSHVYTIANWETFASPMGRHVLILQQLLPVIWAKLGGSTAEIMQLYVINDTLLHVAVFLMLLLVLTDVWAALLAISVHVFGMCFNHFMMVGELHPGSMFAILTLSLVTHWSKLSTAKKLWLLPAAFFAVSSHPLALISFLTTFWIWRFSTEEHSPPNISFSIGITLGMIVLKLLLLDDYDVETVNESLRTTDEAVLSFLDPSYLLNFILFFLFSSPVVSIMLVFGIIYLLADGQKLTGVLLTAFFLGWSLLIQKYLDFTYFSLDFIQSMMHDRYLFPIRFVTLAVVVLIIAPKLFSGPSSTAAPVYIMASWMLGIPFLVLSSTKADRTISEFRNAIYTARSQNINKGFYPIENYCDDTYIHRGSFFATLVLSNLEERPAQVIHASETTIEELMLLDENEILLMDGVILNTEHLERGRIVHPKGKYQSLDYTCE